MRWKGRQPSDDQTWVYCDIHFLTSVPFASLIPNNGSVGYLLRSRDQGELRRTVHDGHDRQGLHAPRHFLPLMTCPRWVRTKEKNGKNEEIERRKNVNGKTPRYPNCVEIANPATSHPPKPFPLHPCHTLCSRFVQSKADNPAHPNSNKATPSHQTRMTELTRRPLSVKFPVYCSSIATCKLHALRTPPLVPTLDPRPA
jgi:hypothetical protein